MSKLEKYKEIEKIINNKYKYLILVGDIPIKCNIPTLTIVSNYQKTELLKENINVTDEYKEAVLIALQSLFSLKRRNEITLDFQGWPVENIEVADLLKTINDSDDKNINDFKIRILEDDGMGYGAKNGFCNTVEIDSKEQNINLWFN